MAGRSASLVAWTLTAEPTLATVPHSAAVNVWLVSAERYTQAGLELTQALEPVLELEPVLAVLDQSHKISMQ